MEMQSTMDGQGTVWSTAINILCGTIGAGVLTMPLTFQQASIPLAVALIIFVAAMECFTLLITVETSAKLSAFSFRAILSAVFSRKVAVAFDGILAVSAWGCLIIYLRVSSEQAAKTITDFGLDSNNSEIVWLSIFSVTFITLSLFEFLHQLKFTSLFGFLVLVGVVVLTMKLCLFDGSTGDVGGEGFTGACLAIATLSGCFGCQYTVPIFLKEMSPAQINQPASVSAESTLTAEESDLLLHSSRISTLQGKVKKMRFSIFLSIASAVTIYVAVGSCGLLAFGTHSIKSGKGDILSSFPSGAVATAARWLVVLHFFGTFPVFCVVARKAFNFCLAGKEEQDMSRGVIVVETAVMVVTATLIAYAVPGIGVAFGLNCALFGALCTLMVPSLAYLRVAKGSPLLFTKKICEDDGEGDGEKDETEASHIQMEGQDKTDDNGPDAAPMWVLVCCALCVAVGSVITVLGIVFWTQASI